MLLAYLKVAGDQGQNVAARRRVERCQELPLLFLRVAPEKVYAERQALRDGRNHPVPQLPPGVILLEPAQRVLVELWQIIGEALLLACRYCRATPAHVGPYFHVEPNVCCMQFLSFRWLQGLIKAGHGRAAVVSYCRLLPFNRLVRRHDEGPELVGLGVPVQSMAVAKVELRVGICAKPSVLRPLANWGQQHVNVRD